MNNAFLSGELIIVMFLSSWMNPDSRSNPSLLSLQDTATEAGTAVRGGQTVRSPWLLLGGVASSVCSREEQAQINAASPGNVLVLTKPLGTQLAVNSYEWVKKGRREKLDTISLTESQILIAFQQAIRPHLASPISIARPWSRCRD